MLEKFKSEITKPILQGNGDKFNQELQNLGGKNWINDIKLLSHDFELNSKLIIDDISNCLKSNTYQDIQASLSKGADSYQKYYTQTKDKSFLSAKETFIIIGEYIDKLVANTQKKLTRILIQNPGIETQRSIMQKLFTPNDKTDLDTSHTKDVEITLDTNQEISPKQIFFQDLSNILSSNKSLDQQIDAVRESFLDNYNMKNKSLKKLYRELGLQDEYIQYIKELDLDLILILLKIKLSDNQEQSFESELYTVIEKYLPSEKRKTHQKGPKILGTIDVSKEKPKFNKPSSQEILQESTTDPLSLVGQNISSKRFLSAFSLSYDEIEQFIRDKQSIPARYNNSTKTDNGALHFFTIGSEKKGIDDIFINVSVLNGDKIFNIGQIYEIVLTQIYKNEKSTDYNKKQTHHVQGILKENFKDYQSPSSQKLGDINPDLIKLKDNMPK